MFGFLKKILGSKSDKDLKEIYPLVDKINSEYGKLNTISDEDLRSKTEEFKLKIKNFQLFHSVNIFLVQIMKGMV